MSQPTAPRTGSDAEQYARSRVGSYMPDSGLCLQNVRQNYGIPSYYYSAIDAWNGAKARHPGDRKPPSCVSVFFDSPSQYKHVATYCPSDGSVVSTNGARIDRFSSISHVENSGFGPYMGWTEDLNKYRVHTGSEDGGDDVSADYRSTSTRKGQTLSQGKWQTLVIDDDDHSTIWSTPGHFQSLIEVYLEGLPAGKVAQIRHVTVDYKSGQTTQVVGNYPIEEIVGSAGGTYGKTVQFGSLGSSDKSGWSRRLRAAIYVPDVSGVRVTYVGSKAFLL